MYYKEALNRIFLEMLLLKGDELYHVVVLLQQPLHTEIILGVIHSYSDVDYCTDAC